MREWDVIDSAPVPEDDGHVLLMSRGSEWAVYVDDQQLMTNRAHGSEAALADWACDRLDPDHLPGARILVGGMGCGFTLAAALRRVGPAGQVTVAELIPSVVSWNRDYQIGKASGYPLADPRTRVHLGDVGDLVERPPAPWSAILIDTDNGPMYLTRPGNGWLYHRQGLTMAYDALCPGGILGIWSAATDRSLTRRLRKTGFEAEQLLYHEPGRPTPDGSGTQVLWMARKPA